MALIEKFEAYIPPRKFLTYRQEEGQSFESFFTDFKKSTSDCELDHLKESLIRDMRIIGLHDKKLQERLLREINLEICQTIELIR